jgi:hypothetical protein
VKGVSVKPYIFVGDTSLLMHEKNLVAGRRPPASQALRDDAGANEGGGRAKDGAQAAGQRGGGKELYAEGLEEDLIFSHVSSFLQSEQQQQHTKKRARKTCKKRELQVSAPSHLHTLGMQPSLLHTTREEDAEGLPTLEVFAQARAADVSLELEDVGMGPFDEGVAALALAHTTPHPAPPVPPRPLCVFSSSPATPCSTTDATTTTNTRRSPALPSLLLGAPLPRKVAAVGGGCGGSGGGGGGREEEKKGGPQTYGIVDGAGCGERGPDRGTSSILMGGVRGMGVRGMGEVKIITASPSRLGRVLGGSSGLRGGGESEWIGGARVFTSAAEVRDL